MGTGTPKEPVAPPVPGTAPHTLARQEAAKSMEPQNPIGPALCRLFLHPEKTPDKNQTRRTNSVAVNLHTNTTDTSAQRTSTHPC